MATPMPSCEDSLEALTAMLNSTLIETGRFFRSGGSLQSRTQLKRNLPAVCENYQLILDELQEQIFIAKGILEKDYETIVAKKLTDQGVRQHAAPSQEKSEDATMKDAEASDAPETISPVQAQASLPPSQAQATGPSAAPSASTAPQGPSSTTYSGSYVTAPTASASRAPVSAPLSLPMEQKTNPSKSPDVGGSSEDILSGDGMMDIMASMTATENQSLSAENADIDMGFGSLLPGLESYANAGNDDGIIEIPDDILNNSNNNNSNNNNNNNGQNVTGDMSTHHPPHGNSSAQPQAQTQTQMHHEAGRTDVPMDDVGHTESTFDDLFVGAADFAGDGDELLLHGTDIGDLDDAWFG